MTYTRLKYVANINIRSLPGSMDPGFKFRYIDIGSVGGNGKIEIPEEVVSFEDAPSRARRLAYSGDTIVSTVRTYLRAVARVPKSEDPLVFSTGFSVLGADSSIDSRYLSYSCLSDKFIDEVVARSVGVSYPAVNASDVGNIPIRVPDLTEQRRIADFLDAEVVRIDGLLSVRRSQAKLLGERFHSRVVSEIGRHRSQRLVQLRRAISKVQTGATPTVSGGTAKLAHGELGRVSWYNPGSLDNFMGLGAPKGYLASGVAPRFREGSVLFVGIGESIGKVAYLDHEASGNQQITALCPKQNSSGKFLAWQLWSMLDEFRNSFPYTRVRIVNNEDLLSSLVHVPPLEVQENIADQLDREADSLKGIRDAFNEFEVLVEERKRALITAAVTGQIDVTTARGADVS